MSEPYIGEIRVVPYNFAPLGWLDCNGQLISIADNTALFALIGTTYGGDGQTTFALPNFQSRVMMGVGLHSLGEMAGEEVHTLTPIEMPTHTHVMNADNDLGGTTGNPTQGVYAALSNAAKSDKAYGGAPDNQAAPGMISVVGGSQPHENRMPFLGLRVIIAMEGIFPPRN